MEIVTIVGLIGLCIVVGTSTFLFRKRSKENFEENKKEVMTLTLRGLQDVDMIWETVSKGNVVILGVKDLAKLDMIRLKRSVQQLKSYTLAYGGDIFALGKDFVVVIPPNMKLSFIKRMMDESNTEENLTPPEPPKEVGIL